MHVIDERSFLTIQHGLFALCAPLCLQSRPLPSLGEMASFLLRQAWRPLQIVSVSRARTASTATMGTTPKGSQTNKSRDSWDKILPEFPKTSSKSTHTPEDKWKSNSERFMAQDKKDVRDAYTGT